MDASGHFRSVAAAIGGLTDGTLERDLHAAAAVLPRRRRCWTGSSRRRRRRRAGGSR